MGYRKTYSLFVALFLVLSIFATSAFAEACFCGQACLHGLQPKPKKLFNFPFHKRCPDTLCKSCDLEKGQKLKAANASTRTPNVKIYDTAVILSVPFDFPSKYQILKDVNSFYTCETVPSSPIYLQKSSLLC